MSSEATGRRAVLKRTVGFVAGLVAVAGVGYAGSQPAAAVETDDEFLADDVHVERNDGTVRAVTAAPRLDLRWKDFGGGIEAVEVTVSAALADEQGFDVLFDGGIDDEAITVETDGFDTTSGSATLTLDRLDLTARGDSVQTGDFGGNLAPGESEATAVELTLRVDIVGTQEETITTLETAEFDVTVHNPEGEASTTGRANTEVS